MSLFYRAEGATVYQETEQGIVESLLYYESAIVLYEGAPPATNEHTIAAVHVVRGFTIAEFKTKAFEIEENGTYFVAFYSGSYDQSSGDQVGADIRASMVVGEVSVSTP